VLSLISLCCRTDNAGITRFVRVLQLVPQAYHRFLHFFHSDGICLDRPTTLWVGLCLRLFRPFAVNERLVFLADGIKVPKEGRKMPAVKSLRQHSGSNTKPDRIMGHSLQAVSLLVCSFGSQVSAIPLVSRIHEGLIFTKRDRRTLLDKLVASFASIVKMTQWPAILVADAYYASQKVIKPLLARGQHLVTRTKEECCGFSPVRP